MPGISPKLPLAIDTIEVGYALNKTVKQVVQQNLKNLILTNPGERIMDSRFGVGVKQYLFENFSENTSQSIISAIRTQVSRYMPFVNIIDIKINDSQDVNKLYITIRYLVPTMSIEDVLSLDIPRQ